MSRYVYALVRCVPNPRTGEFINMAAIAGRPETGDWSVRQVSNESRVRKLAGAEELQAIHGFLARVGLEIDKQQFLFEEESGEPLSEDWLQQLYHDHRNVVQLSAPAPIVAESAEQALDTVFSRQIIDPISQQRSFITKHRVLAELRDAYLRADIDNALIHQKVEVYAGGHVHAPVDFAIANGTTVQLTQGWSFQKAGVDEVSTQVKAWGYALRLLRDGEDARVVSSDERLTTVSRDVDLQVVVASPQTPEQETVFEEAQQVFSELGVSMHDLDDVDAVGAQAAKLLRRSSSHSQED
jgi:hypothetical protein